MTPNTPLMTDSLETVVTEIFARISGPIRLATPLGLGKPYYLLNAIYDAVAQDPSIQMTIYTALSLNPPAGKSDLERRFLTPFVQRLYGRDFPRLKYADANSSDSLPPNIQVQEFYMSSGALLGSQSAQSAYASLNYTHVADALAARQINVVVQKLAQNGQGQYSLSCNTDLTLDILQAMSAQGYARPMVIGVVDAKLPFIGTEAIIDGNMLDIILTSDAGELTILNPGVHIDADVGSNHSETKCSESSSNAINTIKDNGIDAKLFAAPRQPVDDIDYAIGLYASTLIKDGGTLQIGIGALADALCHALVLRHNDNATYRRVLKALDANIENHPTIKAFGGLEPFEIGLYGCSEMLNEGFRLLVQQGIIKRRVVDDAELMQRINEGRASDEDLQRVQSTGQYLHGAFFLGSPEFYEWLNSLQGTDNTVGMRRISQINAIIGEHYAKEIAKRQHARFFNTCMMATALGGAASETLPDGKVVSGVGGQYNFVSMAHSLPQAKSILMLRSTRTSRGETKSNILWTVANLTIPRHLRDVYITEYGIADLRFATDSECIAAMVQVSDSRFAADLLKSAQDSGKLKGITDTGDDIQTPQNTPETLLAKLAPFRQDGTLPTYPLGSDFTETEQDIVRALSWLKSNTQTTTDKIGAVFDVYFDAMKQSISDKFIGFISLYQREDDVDKVEQRVQAAMVRMGYQDEAGNEIEGKDEGRLDAEMLEHALRETL